MSEPEAVPVLVMRYTDDPAHRPTFDTHTMPLAAVDTVGGCGTT